MKIETKYEIGQNIYVYVNNKHRGDYQSIYKINITGIMITNKGIFYQGHFTENNQPCSDWWDENYTSISHYEILDFKKD